MARNIFTRHLFDRFIYARAHMRAGNRFRSRQNPLFAGFGMGNADMVGRHWANRIQREGMENIGSIREDLCKRGFLDKDNVEQMVDADAAARSVFEDKDQSTIVCAIGNIDTPPHKVFSPFEDMPAESQSYPFQMQDEAPDIGDDPFAHTPKNPTHQKAVDWGHKTEKAEMESDAATEPLEQKRTINSVLPEAPALTPHKPKRKSFLDRLRGR